MSGAQTKARRPLCHSPHPSLAPPLDCGTTFHPVLTAQFRGRGWSDFYGPKSLPKWKHESVLESQVSKGSEQNLSLWKYSHSQSHFLPPLRDRQQWDSLGGEQTLTTEICNHSGTIVTMTTAVMWVVMANSYSARCITDPLTGGGSAMEVEPRPSLVGKAEAADS